MLRPLSELNDRSFDVLVVGAGINGASAAQHLAATGYAVLLVDRADFGGGTTGRSSRLLHCGVRYFVPGRSMMDFVRKPATGVTALKMARAAMRMRAQFKRTTPDRLQSLEWCYPIYRGGQYAPWQFDVAFRLLSSLGPSDVPLGYRKLSAEEARRTPLLEWQHDPERLLGVAMVEEFQFDWPERLVIDAVLDAERLGATVRNHTEVSALAPETGGGWTATLSDRRAEAEGETATVSARTLVNASGIWIDRVNQLTDPKAARRVHGTKGIHVAFRLPPECANRAVVNFSRDDEPLFCAPFRDLYYAGPTEVNYDGDIDSIEPTEAEIDLMIEELARVLPGMGIRRRDILFAWAGVRPLTYGGAAYPKGNRLRVLHDLDGAGMQGALALTAGPIMTHRSAAREIVEAISKRVEPSGESAELSYAASTLPEMTNSPSLTHGELSVKVSDLRHVAEHEHPGTLTDILFRRLPVGWSADMGYGVAERAAESVADILGWDRARIDAEVAAYRAELRGLYRVREAEHAVEAGAA